MKKLNKDEFISKSKAIHNGKFGYDLVEYKNVRTKVKIICKKHGIFEQLPWVHMNGNGCSKCQNLTRDDFIEKSIKKHNDIYDYNMVDIKNNKTKVKIICKKHGIFEQSPNAHLNGNGCRKCFYERKKLKIDTFIKKSNDVHNGIYNYDLVDLKNNKTKVSIICKNHGVFEQGPNHHLLGVGCPMCSSSKGEKEILEFIDTNNIKYERQKTFEGCKFKSKLRFDFYLPEYELCIEYNGIQHYEEMKHFGGLNYIKRNDKIKDDFCRNHNINLTIISYKDNILDKLKSIIF